MKFRNLKSIIVLLVMTAIFIASQGAVLQANAQQVNKNPYAENDVDLQANVPPSNTSDNQKMEILAAPDELLPYEVPNNIPDPPTTLPEREGYSYEWAKHNIRYNESWVIKHGFVKAQTTKWYWGLVQTYLERFASTKHFGYVPLKPGTWYWGKSEKMSDGTTVVIPYFLYGCTNPMPELIRPASEVPVTIIPTEKPVQIVKEEKETKTSADATATAKAEVVIKDERCRSCDQQPTNPVRQPGASHFVRNLIIYGLIAAGIVLVIYLIWRHHNRRASKVEQIPPAHGSGL